MENCKFCGSRKSVFVKERYSGTFEYKYNMDGSEADNSGMYDHLNVYTGKHVYCSNCRKRLMPLNEFLGESE